MPLKNGSDVFFICVKRLEGGILSERTSSSGSKAVQHGGQAVSNSQRKSKKVGLIETLGYAEKLASALDYMHNGEAVAGKVLLHRDLKPDNIGFTEMGDITIFDFGLATTIPVESEQNNQGDIDEDTSETGGEEGTDKSSKKDVVRLPRYRLTGNTGSARYMAPEVALDNPYNQSVDVYAFILILW